MLRTALIGMGDVGAHLAREVVEHPDATLAAVMDVDPDNLATAGEEFGVEEDRLFTDAEEMYATTPLDAVIVASPPAFHYDQIHDAVERGHHVFCEKPVVLDAGEARDVLELVEGTDRVLMTGYQRHLQSGFVAARERWRDGGPEPRFVSGTLTQDWTDYFEHGENWRTDPEIGGRGHLFSVGTHVVESILWMTGLTPESVTAEMDFYDDAGRIDTQASLSVRFRNGAIASLGDSATVPVTREHVRVWDDEGAVYLDGENWGDCELTVIEDGDATIRDLAGSRSRGRIEAFVEAIETGADPPATAEDALRVTALLDAAYEAARTGERVAVDLD